jgi:carbonic anhydrase/acetyltransferase-like protein (isoleucine patch superfamily)
MIRPYRGKRPEIAASAYIDPAAVIIGDVVIGDDSSVWPCTVIRGDVNYIRIGARTNIQDASVLHVMRDEYPLLLGDDVTIGHSVTLHGCNIAQRCLIGMGSIILNGVTIGEGSIIAAGTLILERTEIPPQQPGSRPPQQNQAHPDAHRPSRHRRICQALRSLQKYLPRGAAIVTRTRSCSGRRPFTLSREAWRALFPLNSSPTRESSPNCHSERSRPIFSSAFISYERVGLRSRGISPGPRP